MPKYRRSRFLLFTLEDLEDLDDVQAANPSSLVATSIVSGQHILLDAEEVERLRRVPCSRWVDQEFLLAGGFKQERIDELVDLGIFFSTSAGEDGAGFREKEELLEQSHWPPFAAAFHLLNHYHESRQTVFGHVVSVAQQELSGQEKARRFIGVHGPPPPEFHETADAGSLELLPLELRATPLAEVLKNRRTCRRFEPGAAIALQDFSSLLRLVFGAWGIRRLAGTLSLLLKTSPSGGSLHPVEAFPVIFKCEERESGLYHYRGDRHALAPFRKLEESELRRLAVHWAQGQDFVGTCSVLVLLVARFDRSFWKYRERENAYSVVLQDAGHLSQTFQLAATDLGLGSFYTGAINSDAMAEFLQLRYPAEAPLGILGAGIRSPGPELAAAIEPFSPDGQGI